MNLEAGIDSEYHIGNFHDRDNHTGGSIVSSQKVGPSIADDIKTGAIYSVVLALLAIGLYILLRFRNIAYSIGSIVALSCDTIMIIGAYSLFWGILPFSLEIDQTFIGAILTAIGYSINDKVVIFDRVREFFGLYPKRDKRVLFNDSLNTTLARTINTSLSTLIVLLCIFILGGDSIPQLCIRNDLGCCYRYIVITVHCISDCIQHEFFVHFICRTVIKTPKVFVFFDITEMSFCLDRTCLPFQDSTLTLDVCMGFFTQFFPLLIDLHYLVSFSIFFGIIFIQTACFMFASTAIGAAVYFKGLGITILLFGFRSYVT